MSIVSAIYKAPVIRKSYRDDIGETSVVIRYNGKNYRGKAILHIDDRDFYSSKVGRTIALSRARISAMKAELKREELNLKINKAFFYDTIHSKDLSLDELIGHDYVTELLLDTLNRMTTRCNNLRAAINLEKQYLATYIKGQEKAVKTVKRFRSQGK